MELIYVVGVGLVVAVFAVAAYSRATEGYKRKLAALELANANLESKRARLEEELHLANAQMEHLQDSLEEMEKKLIAAETEAEAEVAEDLSGSGPVQALTKQGIITGDDLRKVRQYLENTKSPMSEEEALVVLGIVSSSDMSFAKRKSRNE